MSESIFATAKKGGWSRIQSLRGKTTTVPSTVPTFVSKRLEEPSREQWLKLAEASGAVDFWNRPEEDIYSVTDGEPA